MFKIIDTQRESLIINERKGMFCVVERQDAKEFAKGYKCSVKTKREIYQDIEMLIGSGKKQIPSHEFMNELER